MNIRVVGDGTFEGTRVEHAETGELIEWVKEVRFTIVPGEGQQWAEVVIACPITRLDIETNRDEALERASYLLVESLNQN